MAFASGLGAVFEYITKMAAAALAIAFGARGEKCVVGPDANGVVH